MIAKPLLTSPGWIESSIIEKESYPTIQIKVLPPSTRWTITTTTTTTTNNKLPLVVQFGWSDLPCQGDDYYYKATVGVQPTTTTSCNHQVQDVVYPKMYELRDYIPQHLPPPPPPSPTSCCCDDISLASSSVSSIPSYDTLSSSSSSSSSVSFDEDDIENDNAITYNDAVTRTECDSTAMQQHKKTKKHVSFAPLVRVRVHTVILGDHPMCTGGMALQLGWESSSTQYIPLQKHDNHNQRNQNQHQHQNRTTMMNQLRLSYAQRRQRLQELTGLTTWQLLQQEYLLVCCCNQPSSSTL